MAASQTVPQYGDNCNFSTKIQPRQGVVTLFGYGIRVLVERGHLVVEDGIGPDRRHARLPRVGHGLRRLVVIGSDGFVSLSALRWLADQNAALVMLERGGALLAASGPVRPSDARLRRAQALAGQNGMGLQLATRLIGEKLKGQEKVVRERLRNTNVADKIARFWAELKSSTRLEAVSAIEASAASAYWSAWSNLEIFYPRTDLTRIPDHWRIFGARVSPLTGSPRLAVNPPNATLNYLYAILESESHLAAAELGLDPGLGVLHKDRPNRESLACDLMEPIRPLIDAYVFDWLQRGPLRREWFFETTNGNCRLMGPFVTQLSETAPAWRRAVAPYAEEAARIFWHGRPKNYSPLPTRLTQARRSEMKVGNLVVSHPRVPQTSVRCSLCGSAVSSGSEYCAKCVPDVSRENLLRQAKLGQIATHSAIAEARRSATQAKQAKALREWDSATLPKWLDEDFYRREILPQLSNFTVKKIRLAVDVSHPYATLIKRGDRIPHPRHWPALANLVGYRR